MTLFRIDCEHADRDDCGVTLYASTEAEAITIHDVQTRRGYWCDVYPVDVRSEQAAELLIGCHPNAASAEQDRVVDLLLLNREVPS